MYLSVRFGAAREGELQVLWEDGEQVLCPGWILDADRRAVLVVLPAASRCPPDVGLTMPTIRLRDMRDDTPARRGASPDRPLRQLTGALPRARRTIALRG